MSHAIARVQPDNPAADLDNLVLGASVGYGSQYAMVDRTVLLEKLSVYLAERDEKLAEHFRRVAAAAP